MSLHLITGYAGEEHITSSDHASFNIAMFGDGEFVLNKGNKFEASVISNNLIRILDGDLVIQGKHVRLKENTYEELELENGSQGMYRNDLIVARYSKASVTGIEKCEFVVLKGEESESEAVDPTYTTADITELGNALLTDFPLYRIQYDGLNIASVTSLFDVKQSLVDHENNLGNIRYKYYTGTTNLNDPGYHLKELVENGEFDTDCTYVGFLNIGGKYQFSGFAAHDNSYASFFINSYNGFYQVVEKNGDGYWRVADLSLEFSEL